MPLKNPLGIHPQRYIYRAHKLGVPDFQFLPIFYLPNVKTYPLCYRQQACHAINKCSWCKHCGMACHSLSFRKLYTYSTPFDSTHAKTRRGEYNELCSNHETTGKEIHTHTYINAASLLIMYVYV